MTPGTPLTEAGRRLLDAYFRHEDDLAGGGIEHLVATIEREAATRVEADLRARIEAEVVRQRDLIAAEPSSEWRRGALATVEWVAAQIVPSLAATEAPREHKPGRWCGECGDICAYEPTEDRDEPTMKDRARARMHRATPRPR